MFVDLRDVYAAQPTPTFSLYLVPGTFRTPARETKRTERRVHCENGM